MKKLGRVLVCIVFLVVFALFLRKIIAKPVSAADIDLRSDEYCIDVAEQTVNTAEELSAARLAAKENIDFERSFLLYNLADQPIAIFYQLKPVGFAVYDFNNGLVLEYTTETNSKYDTDLSQKYYYEGIGNYYQATPEGFENLMTGQIKKVESDYKFTSADFYAWPWKLFRK